MSHRVLVCGGRDYSDAERIYSVLDHYNKEAGGFDIVIQGEARGADLISKMWAVCAGVPTVDFPADWSNLDVTPCVVRKRRDGSLYNAAAGAARNQQMIDEGKPTLGICFPGGTGTRDMISRLHHNRIPYLEIPRA